jgi:site-specific DNA recombinase
VGRSKRVRAGIYCRISSDRDDVRLGVDRQEEDCRRLCSDRGWDVADVFIDNNVSAANPGRTRPEYTRLLTAIAGHSLDAVVVWDLDRLHRRPLELEQFFEVCDKVGMSQLASVGGDVDLSTGEGLMIARIKGAVAAEEARKTSRRIRRKQEELAQRGLPSGGGTRPFGFMADRITIDEFEADLIRDAAERVLLGESLYSIRKDWTERGINTVTGAPWSVTAIRTTLIRPRTAGRRQFKGEDIGPACWEPILEMPTWERVRAILLDPARRQRPPSREYPLYGILHCGACGRHLVATPRANGRNYGCRKESGGCGHVFISAKHVEGHVLAFVLPLVDSPALAQTLAGGQQADRAEVERLVGEIADDRRAKAELGDDYYQAKLIDKAMFLRQDKALRQRIEANENRLSSLQGVDALVGLRGNVKTSWKDFTPEQRRRVLKALLASVEVARAKRRSPHFDSSRIAMIWRFDTLFEIAEQHARTMTPEDWHRAEAEYRALADEALDR